MTNEYKMYVIIHVNKGRAFINRGLGPKTTYEEVLGCASDGEVLFSKYDLTSKEISLLTENRDCHNTPVNEISERLNGLVARLKTQGEQ